MIKKFTVIPAEAGTRADILVATHFPQYSRSALSGLFNNGLVKIDGTLAKAGQKVKAAEKLSIDISPLSSIPDPIELPVVYEDEDVIVIDKPAGILTHSKGALSNEATVASFIKPKITDKEMSGNRAGIVH